MAYISCLAPLTYTLLKREQRMLDAAPPPRSSFTYDASLMYRHTTLPEYILILGNVSPTIMLNRALTRQVVSNEFKRYYIMTDQEIYQTRIKAS